MTTRTRKDPHFDVTLTIKDEAFIAPPEARQQDALLAQALDELADDLIHLDRLSARFVSGAARAPIPDTWVESPAQYDESELVIDGQQVVQLWERPYLRAMAAHVTETHGDVLEIGFGMGMSASFIQEAGVKSHTIIECNAGVRARFDRWRAAFPGRDIRIISGTWQEATASLSLFDAILFDTNPTTEREFAEHLERDATYAQHFFAAAASHLRDGGVFTYWSNEIDSVSRRHQRELFKHFRSVTFSVCRPLAPDPDCDYWWADSMVVTRCVK